MTGVGAGRLDCDWCDWKNPHENGEASDRAHIVHVYVYHPDVQDELNKMHRGEPFKVVPPIRRSTRKSS